MVNVIFFIKLWNKTIVFLINMYPKLPKLNKDIFEKGMKKVVIHKISQGIFNSFKLLDGLVTFQIVKSSF